jgi:hypothetical protein
MVLETHKGENTADVLSVLTPLFSLISLYIGSASICFSSAKSPSNFAEFGGSKGLPAVYNFGLQLPAIQRDIQIPEKLIQSFCSFKFLVFVVVTYLFFGTGSQHLSAGIRVVQYHTWLHCHFKCAIKLHFSFFWEKKKGIYAHLHRMLICLTCLGTESHPTIQCPSHTKVQ